MPEPRLRPNPRARLDTVRGGNPRWGSEDNTQTRMLIEVLTDLAEEVQRLTDAQDRATLALERIADAQERAHPPTE